MCSAAFSKIPGTKKYYDRHIGHNTNVHLELKTIKNFFCRWLTEKPSPMSKGDLKWKDEFNDDWKA